MPESIAPERLTRKSTSIAQLLARRVRETPDREAYRYPVAEQWRSMTWRCANDTVHIQLVGPSNWAMSTGGQLQVVIARANRAASGQAYSPFGGSVVWMNPPGQMNGNVWQAALGTINLNPGPGKFNYFEITIAFSANLPNVTGPVYFAEDPEMDVDGM